jgi:hypothetical protein
MADCNDLFNEFYEKISLTDSQLNYLKQARDAIRNKIKNYFKEKENIPPKFWIQGSYMMKTIVNPLNGEYDLDDGVYLQNIDTNKDNWPSAETVHNWIYEAVKGHTKEDPLDKRACIRVLYSGKYHVDLPVYGIYKEEIYLAEKGEKGWNISNPKNLLEWFDKQVNDKGEQIIKIIRYFKAWADYQGKSKNKKLPSGLILTILAIENYEKRDRDDDTFGRTIRNINQYITNSFIIYNPVNGNEILSEHLKENQKEDFKLLISNLLYNTNRALGEVNKKEACKIWREEFGDRFTNCDNIEDKLKTSSPALLRDDARSA